MSRPAIHPGEILAEELEETAVTSTELARQLRVPANRITQIIRGKRAISGDTALRLGHWFGNIAFSGQVGTGWPKKTRHLKLAQFWLNLQGAHDIRVAGQAAGAKIARLPNRRVGK
jgi:addiction module HigA family antidote